MRKFKIVFEEEGEEKTITLYAPTKFAAKAKFRRSINGRRQDKVHLKYILEIKE